MHYGLYGRSSNEVAAAVAEGLRAKGHRVTWQRAELFEARDAPRDFERVVICGTRDKYAEARDHHAAEGLPVIIREAPHFRDSDRFSAGPAERQQRMSLGYHAWVPDFPCPPDRFVALGLEIITDPPKGETLLVCGQTPYDGQHGLSGPDLAAWLQRALSEVLKDSRLAALRPVWRPHPMALDAVNPGIEEISSQSLGHDLAEAGAVLAYNSTVGLSAVRLGIPVFIGGTASYGAVADVVNLEADPPVIRGGQKGREAVLEVLSRVAYTQWTKPELRAGAWIATIERAISEGRAAESVEEVTSEEPEVTPLNALSAVLDEQRHHFTLTAVKKILDEQHGKDFMTRKKVREIFDMLTGAGTLLLVSEGGRGSNNPRRWVLASSEGAQE